MRRAVTRLSPRDLGLARTTLERMNNAMATGDLEAFRIDNRAFHFFFFYERCGLPALAERIAGMWQAFPWDLMLNTPERIRQSHLEHVAIVEALESRDIDAVAEATEAHIATGFGADRTPTHR
jgi:DNA-binding GntR family transcriptional regulator